MQRLRFNKSAFWILIAGALLFIWQPFTALGETAGSYAHPGIPGPDEGNAMNKAETGGAATGESKEGSGSKKHPSTRTEGSTKKGYGPGAHPPVHKEGSGSKGYAHGGKYKHGGKYSHGKGYGHGHKKHGHHGGSYAKGYSHGHGKKSPHGGSHGASGHGGYKSGHHGHSGHKTNPFKHILKFRDKLGLSDDQVARIQDMRFNWEKQQIKLGADHMIAHKELDRLVHSGEVNADRMQELAKLLAHIKGQEIQAMVDAKIGLLKALTDEQRKKVAEIHSNH